MHPRHLKTLCVFVAALVLLALAPLAVAQDHGDSQGSEAHAADGHGDAANAEDHGGDHGTDNNIFGGDVGNVLWTVVTLVLVFVVLIKFAWNPLLGVLEQREDFIRDSLAKAKEDRQAAEARLAEYEERLTEARAEATSIVEEGRRDADVVRQRIEEKAQEEADKSLARAKREIEIAKDTAIKDLYALTGQLATDIAAKVVARELKAEDHERLIREALDQLGKSSDQATN
jgi:F-type H+-transporting ATPase subunit b